MNAINEAIDKLGNSFQDFKKSQDDRLSDIELRLNRPGNPGAGGETRQSPEQREYAELFMKWVRNPHNESLKSQLAQKMEVTGTTDAAGGFAVPELLDNVVAKRLLELNPLRKYANVVTVGSSDYKHLVDVGGATSGWVGETDTRNATDTPTLEEVAPTFGMLYAYPKATEESMQDIFFDVRAWLQDSITEEFAITEGVAFISGNGTKKPTGFLNGTPVSTGDADSPPRAFGTLEYVATGVADGFPNDRSDSPPGDPVDVLKSCMYRLKPRYRMGKGVAWAMNNSTAEVISKWKDADGRYIWNQSLVAGEPDTLLGYPVVPLDAMPDIGANAFPIAFGNWKKGYLIADRAGFRMTVDDNITSPGYIKFYARKRVGGKILDDHAIKLIKIAAS